MASCFQLNVHMTPVPSRVRERVGSGTLLRPHGWEERKVSNLPCDISGQKTTARQTGHASEAHVQGAGYPPAFCGGDSDRQKWDLERLIRAPRVLGLRLHERWEEYVCSRDPAADLSAACFECAGNCISEEGKRLGRWTVPKLASGPIHSCQGRKSGICQRRIWWLERKPSGWSTTFCAKFRIP